jgi:predicted RNase H-like nuclease (RuvC/YqgF family)
MPRLKRMEVFNTHLSQTCDEQRREIDSLRRELDELRRERGEVERAA